MRKMSKSRKMFEHVCCWLHGVHLVAGGSPSVETTSAYCQPTRFILRLYRTQPGTHLLSHLDPGEEGVETMEACFLAAAAAAALSLLLTCFKTFSIRQICLRVMWGSWWGRRGLGVTRGPRYMNMDM